MVGVLPLGGVGVDPIPHLAFFWSLKIADYPGWRSQGLQHWKDQVFGLWPETQPLLQQIQAPEQLSLARYSHHTLRYPYGPGLVFIGDSAHATSPQLGQGANMALLDVYLLLWIPSSTLD